MNTDRINIEFDEQLHTLVQKGYPQLVDLSDDEFVKTITPLKERIPNTSLFDKDYDTGTLPFVIVIRSTLVDTGQMMQRVIKDSKNGIVKLYPRIPKDFKPIGSVSVPERSIYLLLNIDRGKQSINIPPSKALKQLQNDNRSPLTIDEGIAIVTHYPEFLVKNNCFSLLASRYDGDKRVPAIWINADKHPNLGWCWEGNPHTWLGSASCSTRVY